MDEASYEHLRTPLKSDLPEQIEVRVRRERRRRWTVDEKLRIVEEMLAPGAVAKQVAERHEISTGLLFTWRSQLIDRKLRFVPVHVATGDSDAGHAVPLARMAEPAGLIEIAMPSGARVRVGCGADLKMVRGILAALGGR
jgi:transposase